MCTHTITADLIKKLNRNNADLNKKNYGAVMKAVLAGTALAPHAREYLEQFREEYHIHLSPDEEQVLLTACGWTKEEFDSGSRSRAKQQPLEA